MLVAAAGVDAGPPDEHVAAQRDEQADAGELDRRAAAVSPTPVREDGEVLERRADRRCGRCTAAGAAAPLTIARFSTVTAIDCVIVIAVPRATRIVAGPWPWMRSERAPLTFDAVADVVDAGREADGAADGLHLVDGVLDRERPDECDSGVTQTVQSQPSSPPRRSGGQSRRQSVCEPGNVTTPSRA